MEEPEVLRKKLRKNIIDEAESTSKGNASSSDAPAPDLGTLSTATQTSAGGGLAMNDTTANSLRITDGNNVFKSPSPLSLFPTDGR